MNTAIAAPVIKSSNWLSPASGEKPLTLFTLRGFILLAFLLLLISGPATGKYDVVASVFGFSFLSIVAIVAMLTIGYGLIIKRSLRCSIASGASYALPGDSLEKIHAGQEASLLVTLSALKIPPFYALRLNIEFKNKGILTTQHQLTGWSSNPRSLVERLKFPHRGNWQIERIDISFLDRLGLTTFGWYIIDPSARQSFRVHPPEVFESPVPIISSCQRSGDLLTDQNERQGDPFDIKPYHPSDGMRRILWKVYAKTGQLLSRHPERSITPEGQVIIFSAADKDEDMVCSQTLAYLKKLDELSLEIYYGCQGMGSGQVAHTPTKSEQLMIDTVWEASAPQAKSIESQIDDFIGSCRSKLRQSSLEKVLIFCSARRVSKPQNIELFINVGSALENEGIKPVFLVVQEQAGPEISRVSRENKASSGGIKVGRLFVEPNPQAPAERSGSAFGFMTVCAQRNWEVITVR